MREIERERNREREGERGKEREREREREGENRNVRSAITGETGPRKNKKNEEITWRY